MLTQWHLTKRFVYLWWDKIIKKLDWSNYKTSWDTVVWNFLFCSSLFMHYYYLILHNQLIWCQDGEHKFKPCSWSASTNNDQTVLLGIYFSFKGIVNILQFSFTIYLLFNFSIIICGHQNMSINGTTVAKSPSQHLKWCQCRNVIASTIQYILQKKLLEQIALEV